MRLCDIVFCPDNLVTGNHTVTYLKPREGYSVLNNLHLGFNARGLTIIRAMCEVVL